MRIVYLIDKKFYLNKLCRARFIAIEHFCKKYDHELIYTGNGWDNYNENTFISENLRLLEPIDYLFCYKPLNYSGIQNLKYTKIIQYNEMYDTVNTQNEISKSKTDIVICHHENDIIKYSLNNIYHIPHCADDSIFYMDKEIPKKIDILLIGAISNAYPLRMRLANIIIKMNKLGWKCLIHKHPGYDCSEAHTNKYLKNMAHIIRSSKICVTCSSKYKYRLTKFIEIPMCGTAIASDIPNEDIDNFSKFVIELDMSMSDKDIIHKLEFYLKNKDQYDKKIEAGLEWSKGYTFDKYALCLQNKLYRPKIYIHKNEGFNWICDRLISEWKCNYHNITDNPNDADIIWLFTPWLWKSLDHSILKNKKVITTIHHIYEPKFYNNNNDDIEEIDKFTDKYHVFDSYTLDKLRVWTNKEIILKPYWCNNKLWNIIDQKKNNYNKITKYNIPDGKFIIGNFIRDTELDGKPKLEKGPDIFIKMVQLYRGNLDKKKYSGVHVILTGFRRNWTINKLKEMGISYSYYQMVTNDVLNELYNILDLYIIGSRVEGGPQSIYEASLTKCPIISTDVGSAKLILNSESIYDYTNIHKIDLDNFKMDIHGNFNRVSKYTISNYINKFNNLFF